MTRPFKHIGTKLRSLFEKEGFSHSVCFLGKEPILNIFKNMLRSRFCEEEIIFLRQEGKVKKFCVSGIGQEAGPAVIATLLEKKDWIIPPYRGYAHVIGKGLPLRILAAEVMGKTAGSIQGRGNLGNFTSPEIGIYPNSDVLGNNFPTAVGMGFAMEYKRLDGIVVVFFGDGAATRSILYGSLNLAALWRLPILWVCENNQYSISTHVSKITATPFYKKAGAFGMTAEAVDGNDITVILPAILRLISHIRQTRKPVFLELKTFRMASHDEVYTKSNWYQDQKERRYWLSRDPLVLAEESVKKFNIATHEEIVSFKKNVKEEIDEAFRWAAKQTDLSPEKFLRESYEH